MLIFVPAGSPIFFLREHRFAVRCRVVTWRHLLWTLFTLLFMLSNLSMCLLHIFLYIFFINIGCATRDVPIPKFESILVPIPILNFNAKPIPILNRYRYRYLNFLVLKLFMYFTNIMFNKSLLYSYMIFVPYSLLVCIIKLIINYNTFNSI